MRYFLDTEFHEDGRTIDLISIGIVAEDGREFYAVNSECDWERAWKNEWLARNVLPNLNYDDSNYLTRSRLVCAVEDFLAPPLEPIESELPQPLADEVQRPEIWGYYADYDWVVFCQLWGTMIRLPSFLPRFCMDIKQLCNMVGNPKLPTQTSTEHNALFDARWNKEAHDFCMEIASKKFKTGDCF